MKTLVLLSIFSIITYTQASGGIVPASTTLIRQATSITHPTTAFTYSHATAPVAAVSYNAPVAYSSLQYSQPLFASALHYAASPLFAHAPVLAHQHQSILAQYPGGLIAHNPGVVAAAQYPVAQLPIQGADGVVHQGPTQVPVQGGSPVIEAAGSPQIPPQQQPIPQAPPQQSPILGGAASAGATFDDDTVSVEAA